jgi:predicted peptidase
MMTSKPVMVAISILFGTAAGANAQEGPMPLEKKTYTDAKGKDLPYRLLKPDTIDPKAKYPLVLFLHGAGERGNDNEAQVKHGVAEFAKAANRKAYPCFLAAPQCPARTMWSDVRRGAGSQQQAAEPAEPARLAMEMLDALQKEFPIDAKRIYITGLSMGGYGTWDLICRYPDKFAAAVPICGGGDEKEAAKIAKMPIWVFHGAKDPAVPVARSRNMVAALKKAGGSPKYTEYPNEGHASWIPAYKDAELFKWLFAQKKD